MGFEDVIDRKARFLDVAQQAICMTGRRSARRLIEIEDGVDDRSALCRGIVNDIRSGESRLMEKRLNDRRGFLAADELQDLIACMDQVSVCIHARDLGCFDQIHRPN
jgi:hypothetical protein